MHDFFLFDLEQSSQKEDDPWFDSCYYPCNNYWHNCMAIQLDVFVSLILSTLSRLFYT